MHNSRKLAKLEQVCRWFPINNERHDFGTNYTAIEKKLRRDVETTLAGLVKEERV